MQLQRPFYSCCNIFLAHLDQETSVCFSFYNLSSPTMTVGDTSRNYGFEGRSRSGACPRRFPTPAGLNHTRSNCHTSRFRLGKEGEVLTSCEPMPRATAA